MFDRLAIPFGLVFCRVGYRRVAIPGVPFGDERGVFPNVEGRRKREQYSLFFGSASLRSLCENLFVIRPRRRHVKRMPRGSADHGKNAEPALGAPRKEPFRVAQYFVPWFEGESNPGLCPSAFASSFDSPSLVPRGTE
jgi:hypothetical protein